MSVAGDGFPDSYQQARTAFIGAATAAGLAVRSHVHPLRGLQGEELAMDVVRDGPSGADAVLIVSSGCHGVEGHCGSGIQVAALRDAAWRATVRDAGMAVVYVHALNPWGFSHSFRATHENIDLNRNFHDFTQPLPGNPGYHALHPLLVPDEWPPGEANRAAVAAYIGQHGLAELQAATSRGQHSHPDGLFFGGREPSWSNLTVRKVLREHARSAKRLAWIDIHTGLGPSGVGERILAAPHDDATLSRARAWWDGGGATPVTSIHDGSSTSAFLTGLMWTSAPAECPQAAFTGMALEYGTQPLLETLQALRGEQWLRRHPDAPRALAESIRAEMRRVFYTPTQAWQEQVVAQAMQSFEQAASGLSR